MKTGTKIKVLREAMGVSQTEVGNWCHVQRATVCRWEKDAENVLLKHACVLAQHFDVPLSFLIDDDVELPGPVELPDLSDCLSDMQLRPEMAEMFLYLHRVSPAVVRRTLAVAKALDLEDKAEKERKDKAKRAAARKASRQAAKLAAEQGEQEE